ncbi:MAG: hypothetical protein MK089_06695 [Phycisphaerales bacterium]|nr:hypothetical protein [Phycisphaerae bacterium]MCH2153013.1 hypothetical protein [Phycisphaerales bacterium]|tara:strand:+ start:113 stop:1858 length:1746 start_codon:yes stop_codon:yes gene_type:complete
MTDTSQNHPESDVDQVADQNAAAHRQRGAAKGTASKFMLFIGASWARTISELIVGFVMAPLLMGSFGLVLFGLYMLIVHFTAAMVGPLRVSLTQLFVKSMTSATASGDDRRIAEVLTNVAVMAGVVGIAFMALGSILSFLAPHLIDFPAEHEIHVRTAIFCEALVIGMLVMRNPWLGLFLVEHRALSFNFDTMMLRWIDLTSFGLAFLPFGWDTFTAFLIIRTVLMGLHCLVRVLLARRLLPAARFRPSLISWKAIRDLTRTGALTTAQPFTGFAFDVIDHYLLNIAFGPIFNAIYAVVNSLRSYARRFGADASVGGEAISADMHERGAHETLVRSLLASMRLVSGIMLICSGMVAIFFGPIVDVWLGAAMSKDEELLKIMTYEQAIDLAWIFVLILLVGGVLMEVCIAGSRFLYGMGLIGKYSGILFAAGISKILLAVSVTVLLLSPWELSFLGKGGFEATLLFPASTLLCQLFFFGFLFPRRLIKLANVPVGRYLTQVWLRPLAAVLPPLAAGAVFVLFIESWTLWHLGLTFVAVGLAFIPMVAFVLLTSEERHQFFNVLKGSWARIWAKLGRKPAHEG